MKQFLDDNFLLSNPTAEILFHTVAKDLPIIDYHNHVNPVNVATNKRFETLASLWINEDPYKHRAMRINGIAEEEITGKVDDKIKYVNWVKTLPKTMGNPLFHWTCLELKRMFGINEILSEKNAESVWHYCNDLLQQDGFGTADILLKWKAEIICTSDDLLDDLTPHKSVTKNKHGFIVLPTVRVDAVIAFSSALFYEWIKKLANQTDLTIDTLDDYEEAIIIKLDYFNECGCKLADVSLDTGFTFIPTSKSVAATLFTSLINGSILTESELISLKSYLLLFLGKEYSKRNWVMQLHIGADRYTSSRLRTLVGPAGGYATIGKACDISGLCSFLDLMEHDDLLPKTILYTLNPADNEAFATLTGSFAEDGVAGKIQFGPAWWYNDHYEGIRQHLLNLSSYGLLSHFVGMTTDSRSVLSFSRHEYFRRVLCNLVGTWVTNGELPNDEALLKKLIRDISYENTLNFIFN